MGKLANLRTAIDAAGEGISTARKALQDVFADAQSKGIVAEYPDELIKPGTGDIRNDIARYNETILGTGYRDSFSDTDYYHGTNADIQEFKPNDSLGGAVFMSPDPQEASVFANAKGGNVMPLYVKEGLEMAPGVVRSYDEVAAIEKAKLAGYDAVRVRDSADGVVNLAVVDPANIRSVNAAFDPAKKDSYNLLASMGGAAVLGGAVLAPEDAEAGVVTKAGKQIIEAFHGSPHEYKAERLVQMPDGSQQYIVGGVDALPDIPDGAEVLQDFPIGRMRMDKIGTGEGAQAYGHGLYNADQEDVARGYRDRLATGNEIIVDGERMEAPRLAIDVMADAQKNNLGHDEAIRQLTEARAFFDDPEIDEAIEFLENVKGRSVKAGEATGNLYQVDIDATPEELLDWDLPLSEQPERVRASVDKIIKERGYNLGITDDYKDAYTQGDLTGENLYAFMGNSTSKDAASEYLNTAGIKGIRYQDGMSRGAEGGTHNYVVFDDQLITIAKKYGISTVLAGSVLAGTMTPEQAQAATGLENFTQRRAAKRDYWKQLKSTMLEGMAGVNRGLVDTLNFVGPDQVNAVLQLSGSENRIPTFSDIPGVQQATQGGYMEPGTARDVVRTGSEFLSPL